MSQTKIVSILNFLIIIAEQKPRWHTSLYSLCTDSVLGLFLIVWETDLNQDCYSPV